ncbi:unnamed protein product [Cochlearia groenlandica]
MSDARDVEDRVDFDEGNYSEMEDEVEEEQQVEEYIEEEDEEEEEDGLNPNAKDVNEYGDREEEEEGHEEVAEDDDDNNIDIETGTPEDDEDNNNNHIDIETAEEEEDDEEKSSSSPIDEEESGKYSHLLSLPPHGSEVFIGGLTRDVGEEDLRDLCEAIGEIFEVRLVKDRDSGDSKGFAFVAFKNKDIAQKAIEELHNKEFKGKTIRCSLSETKNRLFIGNIPKTWTEHELRKVIEDVGPGVENIEFIKDPTDSSRNRGFGFVLYYNNACADYSRQKMIDSSFKLDGNVPTVTWADPKLSPDNSAAAAQVKALYVKNIPENTSTELLKELFQRHGEVTKVVTPLGKGGKRDFGFVHYAERSSALKAVNDTERFEINGQPLEVVLAKPQAERKQDTPYSYGAAPTPAPFAHPPATFGGFAAAPYGAMGIAGSFNQPMIYGSGAMPGGMQMVPMLLPDGRVGYVLQQPGIQMAQQPPPQRPRRDDRSNGSNRGSSRDNSRDYDDGNNRGSRRYRPY